MSEPKRYVIETMADLLSAYRQTENKENLIQDVKAFLVTCAGMLEIIESIGEVIAESAVGEVKKFTWVDDGKHNATIHLVEKGKDA